MLAPVTALLIASAGRTCKIDPWGDDALAVVNLPGRGALQLPGFDNKGWPTRASQGGVHVTETSVTNGNIVGVVGADGRVTITRKDDGSTVLREVSSGSSPSPGPAPPGAARSTPARRCARAGRAAWTSPTGQRGTTRTWQ